MYYISASTAGVHLPLREFGAGGKGTQGSGFSSTMRIIDSGAEGRSGNMIPMKRRFTVEGRIWEPQVKSCMTGDAKLRRLVDDDRISNLPGELIHCILAHLPFQDVARTSVLSKTWRNIWKMHTRLILDETFFRQVNSKKTGSSLAKFSAAVDMIFSIHTGPIFDFKLYVPPKIHQSNIHRWMEHLSKKGVRALEFHNSEKNASSIPSYIFDCSELTQLKLLKWTLSPPHKSGCFANLISVYLVAVLITADLSFGNQLQKLDLIRCKGIKHLSCQFTNYQSLRRLCIFQCDKLDWRCFECPNKLEIFCLLSSSANNDMNKSADLITFLGNSPRIYALSLDDLTLEVPVPAPSILERLTTKMVNLRKLRLYYLGYNLSQMSTSLCLIRNLPNLQDLYIALKLEVIFLNPLQSTIESYLESVDWTNVLLHQLRSVEISGVVGQRSALHLIKLLLASSPLLTVMSLVRKKSWNINDMLRTEQELLQFPKKSSQAQLIWRTLDY